MRKTKQIILSHKSSRVLASKLRSWEQKGWKEASPIYSADDGLSCINMEIEQRPTIYTSITGILYSGSDEKQKHALEEYRAGRFEGIKFISSAVNNLIELLESIDAKLKVHSMWRYRLFGESEKMTQLFLANGFQQYHLHDDFFVKFKGKDGFKVRDIEFSVSDNSLINIVIDNQELALPQSFITHTVSSTGLSVDDVKNIKSKLHQTLNEKHRNSIYLGR